MSSHMSESYLTNTPKEQKKKKNQIQASFAPFISIIVPLCPLLLKKVITSTGSDQRHHLCASRIQIDEKVKQKQYCRY